MQIYYIKCIRRFRRVNELNAVRNHDAQTSGYMAKKLNYFKIIELIFSYLTNTACQLIYFLILNVKSGNNKNPFRK